MRRRTTGESMSCELWWEAISASLDGELPGDEQSALDAHLARCERCADRRRRAERLHRRLRLHTAPSVPDLVGPMVATSFAGVHRRQRILAGGAALVGVAAAATIGLLVAGPSSPARSAPMVRVALARPAASGGSTVVYVSVSNSGGSDEVIAASSPLAESVELHRAFGHAGEAVMDPVARVPVPAGSDDAIASADTHVMLDHLTTDLAPGDRVPVRLVFARAGVVEVDVTVAD